MLETPKLAAGARVAKWQTHGTQNPASASSWEFDPPPGHQTELARPRVPVARGACCSLIATGHQQRVNRSKATGYSIPPNQASSCRAFRSNMPGYSMPPVAQTMLAQPWNFYGQPYQKVLQIQPFFPLDRPLGLRYSSVALSTEYG